MSIPAGAQAVIVAQNLVAARYLQLTPAYRDSGPTMPSGAVIPVERTAVPIEWDDVKTQLMRLSTDLGPSSETTRPALARLIDDTADAMGGNGVKLRQMLAQLSAVARIFADGSGNIVDIIKGMQNLVTVLRDSSGAIVDFEQRLAALMGTLDDNTGDLDAALRDLATATADAQRFVSGSREVTVEQVERLTDVTRNLADNRKSLEQLLRGAERLRQLLQRLQPRHRRQHRIDRLQQLHQPDPVHLRADRCTGERHRAGDGEAVRPVPRPGDAVAQLQLVAVPDEPVPDEGAVSGESHLLRSGTGARGSGPVPGPPENPPAISAYQGTP